MSIVSIRVNVCILRHAAGSTNVTSDAKAELGLGGKQNQREQPGSIFGFRLPRTLQLPSKLFLDKDTDQKLNCLERKSYDLLFKV